MSVPRSSDDRVPLAGRGRELALLREQLDAALAGRGSLVLIGGEAGIGKTALAEAICAETAGHGALVLIGRCYDLTVTTPYGPWLDLFARYPAGDSIPPPPPVFAARGVLGEVPSQASLSRQLADCFATLRAHRPVILLLEDLHWADPASVDTLRARARALPDLPLLLLVTYRDDEVPLGSPLGRALPALVREAPTTRLSVSPLIRNAIHALVAARYPLPEEATRRLARYLHERSEGNPFFLGELLRALEEEGALQRTSAGWTLSFLETARAPAAAAGDRRPGGAPRPGRAPSAPGGGGDGAGGAAGHLGGHGGRERGGTPARDRAGERGAAHRADGGWRGHPLRARPDSRGIVRRDPAAAARAASGIGGGAGRASGR